MGGAKQNRRKERHKNKKIMDEVVEVENLLLSKEDQLHFFKKAVAGEREISAMNRTLYLRWRGRAQIYAILFWLTLGSWLAFVMYTFGGK